MDEFDQFWAAYPRKTAKGDARKAWAQMAKGRPDLLAKCLDALAWQRTQPQWVKDGGSFIPYPATWLRAEQFDDEPFHAPALSERNVRTLTALSKVFGGTQ